MKRRVASFVSLLLFAFASPMWLAPSLSWAEPPHTWHVPEPEAPPPSASTVPSPTGAPPPPPPSSLGDPIGNTTHAPKSRTAMADAESSIVRAEGATGPRYGLRYTLEGVEVRGNTSTLARVVVRHVAYRAGDTLDVDDRELERTRFRLLGTGFFRDVQLSLRKGSRRGYVVLVVNVVERNTIVVNDVWLGLSADAEPNGAARPLTPFGGANVSETNLGGTGIVLGGAFAVADRQLALRSRFADRDFLRSQWMVEAELLYSAARDFFGNRDVLVDDPTQRTSQDFAVARYRRFGGMVGAGRDLGVSTQLFVNYRIETLDASLPRGASHVRGLDVEPIDFHLVGGTSLLSTLRGTIVYDTKDDPILPSRGEHLLASADVSLTPFGSDYPYTKLVARGSTWSRLPWGHILRLEGFAGAVFGRAPLFERFFVGDFSDLLPDRVLDLNFDRRPAPNFLDTSIVEVRYADFAAKVQAEYRVPLYRGKRAVYGIDLFASLGLYALAEARDFAQAPRGYSGLSRWPIDLTFNTGLRISTSAGGLLFGLSNFLLFLPVRGPDQGASR